MPQLTNQERLELRDTLMWKKEAWNEENTPLQQKISDKLSGTSIMGWKFNDGLFGQNFVWTKTHQDIIAYVYVIPLIHNYDEVKLGLLIFTGDDEFEVYHSIMADSEVIQMQIANHELETIRSWLISKLQQLFTKVENYIINNVIGN